MAQDTITQIDAALHAIRRRLGALEARQPGAATSVRLSDAVPQRDGGAGFGGGDTAAARGDHVHPGVRWTDIADRPDLAGVGQDRTYRHVQIVATETWVIFHNLDKYPSVNVVDSSGEEVIGDLRYDSRNQITLSFSAAISGEAYCN